MSDCLFCKIVQKEIPAKILYEDDAVLVFDDINPQAPVHSLIIPKTHVASLDDTALSDSSLLGKLLQTARDQARARKIHSSGFRTVINSGADGGQTVSHLHVHLLGGRAMGWPPG
ncbi:MAG TPA: histidine triad nucleotide-binding protein [Nitrospiria bacterium]